MSQERVISKSVLFQSLDQSQIRRIEGVSRVVSYPADTIIFRDGQHLGNLYVVSSGTVTLTMDVRLWNREANRRSMISVIEEGGTFGWSALVEPNLATLSAYTMGPCSLVAIDGRKLRRLLEDDPTMGYQVMTKLADMVAQRLRAISMSMMSERALDLERHPIPV